MRNPLPLAGGLLGLPTLHSSSSGQQLRQFDGLSEVGNRGAVEALRAARSSFERLSRNFIAEDCTKSSFCGDSLLTIFANLAYFFGRFRNFGTVVEGLAGKSRVPEAVQKLLLSGIDETCLIQTRVPIDSHCHQNKGQRSFNWQSIAFVMRRLWVQIPPLALFVLGILTENESPIANVV